MFGTYLVFLATVLLSSPATGGQSSGDPVDIALVGVIVTENPSDSIALLRRTSSSRSRTVRIGQEFEGHVLVEVSNRSARLMTNGGEVLLFLVGPDPAPASARSSGPMEAEADEAWIRRSFPLQATRARFQKEMPVILSETDLAPRVEEGEVRGLGVVRLPDGTLLSETGLLPGDVLVSINGEPLRSVGSLWELLSRFVAEGEIRVVVRRKGAVLKLAYAITH